MKKRAKSRAYAAFVGFGLVAAAASGANVSFLETGGFVDNGEIPSVRIVSDDDVEIPFAGEWTGGRCELFVDDVPVGVSDASVSLYPINGRSDALTTYRLKLVTGQGSVVKFVTFAPSSGFCSTLHALESGDGELDSRPAGTVRRLNAGKTMPLAWSSLWSESSDRAEIEIRKGYSVSGESLGTLVDAGAVSEGVHAFSPADAALPPGQYTLTHFDGVETLFSYVNVTGTGLLMIVR